VYGRRVWSIPEITGVLKITRDDNILFEPWPFSEIIPTCLSFVPEECEKECGHAGECRHVESYRNRCSKMIAMCYLRFIYIPVFLDED